MKSSNPTVSKAISANRAVAPNAHGEGDVLVEFHAPDASGLAKVQKRMSPSQFDEWMAKTRNRDKIQQVWFALMKGETAEFASAPIAVSVRAL